MTDEELIAAMRDLSAGPSSYLQEVGNAAADRIEALGKHLDAVKDKAEAHIIDLMAERDRAEARAERLETALREIAKTYPADNNRLIHSEAQIATIARAALKGADHDK